MKINKKASLQNSASQLQQQVQESVSRKQNVRENSNTFQNTQPLNLNQLGLNGNDKMSMGCLNNNMLSESQPILAKANDKPNILLSSNNSQITVHRRNPSHQYSQQIPVNELAQGSLSGCSGGAYMLKLQKYKKMKSELASGNQINKNPIKKSVTSSNQHSLLIADPQAQSQPRNNVLGSQQSHKVSANNSIAGLPHNQHQQQSALHSTKNSQTQQIIFNPHPSSQIIEQFASNKENTNQLANSQHYLQLKQQLQQPSDSNNFNNVKSSQKSQTLKFSINNLLSEITQKSGNQNHHQILNKPSASNNNSSSQNINESSNVQSKLMMQSIIAAKNHSTLINQKHISTSSSNNNKSVLSGSQQQQQLASSKMMMALHKKCNSIANTSNVCNYVINQQNPRDNSQQPHSSNVTCLVLDQDNYNSIQDSNIQVNQYQSNKLIKKPSQQNLLQNYQSQQPTHSTSYITNNQSLSQQTRKNLNQISQIEFFDENVRVNHVPQITPRHQDKRKTLAQPNDRYKNVDILIPTTITMTISNSIVQQHQPQSTKNENQSQIPLSMISNFENYYSRKENINTNSMNQNHQHQNNYTSKVQHQHSASLGGKKQQSSQNNIIMKENAYQSNPNPVSVPVQQQQQLQQQQQQNKVINPNKRYQEESEELSQASSSQLLLDSQRSAFEMKRRSCGVSQNEHHQSNKATDLLLQENIKDQLNNVLMQSQRVNQGAFANFGLRKFSQQLQFSNKLITKQDEMLQNQINQAQNNQQHHTQSQQQVQQVQKVVQNIVMQQQQQQQKQEQSQIMIHKEPETVRRQSKGPEKQVLSNPKDEIVSFFSKYIKQNKQEQNKLFKEDTEYEETIQNLKDFLQYLEDKNIINCKKLENDKEEMTNLIQDLMKLDLNKFSNKSQFSSLTCKNSPSTNNQHSDTNKLLKQQLENSKNSSQAPFPNFGNKRNSGDYYNPDVLKQQYNQNQNFQPYQDNYLQKSCKAQSNIQSPVTQNDKRSIPRNSTNNSNSYKHKLPLNSPNQDYNSRSTSNDHTPNTVGRSTGTQNIVCYYAPVNVNGNGNIVNTNFPIFPLQGSSQAGSTKNSSLQNSVSQSKQFNCSQKLFNSNKNSFDIDEQQQQQMLENNIAVAEIIGNLKNSQMIPINAQQQPIFFQQPPSGPTHKRVNSIGSGLQSKKVSSMLFTPSSSNSNFNNKMMNFGFGQLNQPQPQNQQQQQFVRLDSQHQQNQLQQQKDQTYLNDKHEQLKLKLQINPIKQSQNQQLQQQVHFHQRKNSLFLQQQLFNADDDNNIQLRNKFYPQQQVAQDFSVQNGQDNENEEAIPQNNNQSHKSRLTHRRATTNLIQPSSSQQLAKNIQTLQPPTPTTSSTNQIIASNGQAIFNDDIGLIEERDKLIKYIKLYTSKRLEIPTTTLDYYKFMKLIGKGAFGKVTLGIHKLTGKQVAIKTVDKSLMKDEYQKKKVLQEVHLLKKVRHQNVIRLLEVFESPKHLLMVMEYAGGGDLLQYVKKRRRLEEDEARRIFKQVVYGLAHCHCRSVLHRDIKLDNILLDNEGEIKICDFGVSRIIKKNQRITEQCGTPAYIAPEIISDSGYEGFNADVWSLGVLLYAMICGTVPFKAQNMHDLHQIITSGSFSYPPQVEPLLSIESKDLINKMLVINPLERISIPEILSHPWMINKDEMLLQDDMLDFTNGTFLNKKDMYSMGSSSFPTQSINESNLNEPDINQVQIDNLFQGTNSYKAKLSYTDYCAITQDFATMYMNEEALQVMEGMGLPRKIVREGLNKGELNHATATYNLLVLN